MIRAANAARPISEPSVAAQVAMPILFQSFHERLSFGMTERAEATAAGSLARNLLSVLKPKTPKVAAPDASRRAGLGACSGNIGTGFSQKNATTKESEIRSDRARA